MLLEETCLRSLFLKGTGMGAHWHYLQNGNTKGPNPEEELKGLIASGALGLQDQVWHEGRDGWSTIQSIPELSATLPPHRPASIPANKMSTGSKVAIGCGGLLAFFLFIGIAASISSGGKNHVAYTPSTTDPKANSDLPQSQGQINDALTNEVLRVYNLKSTTGKGH